MNKKWAKTNIVAGVIIKKENKYLLVQEKKKDVYGLWNLPAGHVEIDDSIEKAAIREAFEETGYRVKLIKKIGIFQKKVSESAKHVFLAKIISGAVNYQKDEILDVKWFTFLEIKKMKNKIRNPWVIEAIKILENYD